MPSVPSHQTVVTLQNIGMLPYNPNLVPNILQFKDLERALLEDAQSYLYNAVISFGAAINSINIRNYGWAIVKFYYCVFYLARSKLAVNQVAIVYDKKTPYQLQLISPSSCSLIKQTGRDASSTHKLILKLSGDIFSSNSLLNDKIGTGSILILDWLMKQREIMNYTSVVMPDPDPPKILKQIVENSNINKWLETYKNDPRLYAIDEDHACLAFPFLLLVDVLDEFKRRGCSPNILNQNLNFIKDILREKNNKNLEVVLLIIRNLIGVN
jgi:hypothetical protein